MTDIQLYTKLSGLPQNLKSEVIDFIDFLKSKSKTHHNKDNKRISGQAKGLIKMKDDFDESLEGFKNYLK